MTLALTWYLGVRSRSSWTPQAAGVDETNSARAATVAPAAVATLGMLA